MKDKNSWIDEGMMGNGFTGGISDGYLDISDGGLMDNSMTGH